MAKLWDYYDGEPFMENPHLAVIGNPFKVGSIIERKKSGFRKISQRKGKNIVAYKKKGRKNAPKKHHKKHKRNPFPTAGIAINRPRKRKVKVYHMKKNRSGSYSYKPRRKARRNPAVLGVALPPMHMIAYGAGGFIAPPMVENWANQFLPTSITTTVVGRYAVKIGAVLGLTYLVKTILSAKEAFPVALGGALYVVVSAVNEFVPQLIPHPAPTPLPATGTVQAYRTGMIKAYRSGMIGTGVNGYVNLAGPATQLARVPSDMIPNFNINQTGVANPTWADPRFTQSPFASR